MALSALSNASSAYVRLSWKFSASSSFTRFRSNSRSVSASGALNRSRSMRGRPPHGAGTGGCCEIAFRRHFIASSATSC